MVIINQDMLLEALDLKKIYEFKQTEIFITILGTTNNEEAYSKNIDIHRFGNIAKSWALKQGYTLWSSSNGTCDIIDESTEESIGILTEDTEPDAIILSCNAIFKIMKKDN